jgi:phage N-6-adenine-methyltransferase
MNVHFSSKTPEWSTPQYFFDRLNKEFQFNLDPCATKQNAKCSNFFTAQQDGLKQNWRGQRVFCNPPYGRVIEDWVEKCHKGQASIAVGLLPARTDTRWFHDHIYGKCEIRFIKGRLKFGNGKNSAPFPSMVCIWRDLAMDAKPCPF